MAVNPELDHLLHSAIENKQLLRFKYNGNERIAEPHDYGIQNGIIRLLCWQVGGRSGGRIPGWRLIDVADMEDCEMLNRRFGGNREVLSGKHHRWDKVFIRVTPPEKAKRKERVNTYTGRLGREGREFHSCLLGRFQVCGFSR